MSWICLFTKGVHSTVLATHYMYMFMPFSFLPHIAHNSTDMTPASDNINMYIDICPHKIFVLINEAFDFLTMFNITYVLPGRYFVHDCNSYACLGFLCWQALPTDAEILGNCKQGRNMIYLHHAHTQGS